MNDVSLVCDVGWLEWCIQFSFLENFLARVVVEDEGRATVLGTLEITHPFPRFLLCTCAWYCASMLANKIIPFHGPKRPCFV
jgi:hypothetical protein